MIEGMGYDSNVYIFDDVVVDTGSRRKHGITSGIPLKKPGRKVWMICPSS